MTDITATTAAPGASDDLVSAFQIEGLPVRGRVVRLGAAVDEVLTRHDYPEPVANLLGEACALAALVGSSLKFEGRLIVQAQGDGPVRYFVVDYDTDGGLRGYCRFDPEEVAKASEGFVRPGARTLLGGGTFMMTVDQGPDMDRYQGITSIEGETLDAWTHVQALFETTGEDELIDPTVPSTLLLWRLFNEDGVRLLEEKPLRAFCRCSQERISGMLGSFKAEEIADMVEPDGKIHVTCEYCSREYALEPAAVG